MAAERSVILAMGGFALMAARIVVRPFISLPEPFGILFLACVPGCGLAASVSGVVGIKRARADGGPTATAIFGFLGGLFVLVISVAFLLLLWAISRSNWQF